MSIIHSLFGGNNTNLSLLSQFKSLRALVLCIKYSAKKRKNNNKMYYVNHCIPHFTLSNIIMSPPSLAPYSQQQNTCSKCANKSLD